MEAARYGFATPGGSPLYKFDPTDEDLVIHYLLPRALGLPFPYSHAVIDADPGGLPPWQVLERHGIDMFSGAADQAFFFGPAPDPDHNGGRMVRIVEGGGFWQGQKGEDGVVVFLRPGDGAELEVTFNRYNLTFYDGKSERSTGFVMHEFEIVDPPHLNAMLTRVKFDKARERMAGKLAQEAAAAADGGGEEGDYCVDPLEAVFPRPGEFAGGGYTQAVLDNFYEKKEYEQFLLFQQYEMEQQSWQAGDPSNGGEGSSGGGGEEEQQQEAGGVFCGGGYDGGSDHGSDVGTGGSTISHCGDSAGA